MFAASEMGMKYWKRVSTMITFGASPQKAEASAQPWRNALKSYKGTPPQIDAQGIWALPK